MLRFHLTSTRMAEINRTSDSLAGEAVECGHSCITGGTGNSHNHYGNQCGVSQDYGNQLSSSGTSCNSHAYIYRIFSSQQRHTCLTMFIAALFQRERWKKAQMSLKITMDKEMRHSYTTEHYSTLKENGIMNLETKEWKEGNSP